MTDTTIKKTYELKPGDRLVGGGEVVALARIVDTETSYAVIVRWGSTLQATIDSLAMTWEVAR